MSFALKRTRTVEYDPRDIGESRRLVRGEDEEYDSSDTSSDYGVSEHINLERVHDVQFRTCSWQKTAGLLFSEYISLAVLTFPWAFSIVGIVPGVIMTVICAASVQYTSLILWRLCLKHPEIRDGCDVALVIFGGSRFAYHFTSVMFILCNVFIQAIHCLIGAELLNTLSGSSACTVAFSAITAAVCFVFSLPRTLDQLSWFGIFSAMMMTIAGLLVVVFSATQDQPVGFTGEAPTVTLWPLSGTTYVYAMSAFLNISYALVGQITLPTFIAEMENPNDFPKALWACTISEVVLFSLTGIIVYNYTGNQYIVSPALGSLQPAFKKIAFCFTIPTIIYIGALYSSVTARFVFFRIFHDSEHKHANTVQAWTTWTGIIAVTWIIAFVIAEAIPFFSDLLSLMSSLFGEFIFWGMSYLVLYPRGSRWSSPLRKAETMLNYFLIVFGFYITGAGTYVSVLSIVEKYKAGDVGKPFTCKSNAL
ncbi:uncharacterized protein STEHIDRAFT_132960 [Stereum hirsutum FP-91666 SS1]|uniref:uncharacterized protein n=1 Tax=Stereum hirsutum (strain FP-91666) TaxID=721885 RepID=UPI000444A6C8|nr:uncharacterized protein STEHIDRAFT_132960 [Stereum hirsutum FP-91666 SS1]EIM83842.1 hypothetical protein STEHIDRAFT_132960 [Stereum hirsutum FP-91666 SS1]